MRGVSANWRPCSETIDDTSADFASRWPFKKECRFGKGGGQGVFLKLVALSIRSNLEPQRVEVPYTSSFCGTEHGFTFVAFHDL